MGLTREQRIEKAELLAQGLKRCCPCDRILPLEAFHRNKRSKDGYDSTCPECKTKARLKRPAGQRSTAKRKRKEWLLEFGFKDCRVCERTLPLEAFDRASKHKDGRDSRCKECKNSLIPNAGKRKQRTKEREVLFAQGLKDCPSCGVIKPIEEFSRNKKGFKGLASYCKACDKEKRDLGNTGKRESQIRERKELADQGLKKCSTCKEILPIEEFYTGLSHTWDGRVTQCRECMGYKGVKEKRETEAQDLFPQGLKRCTKCAEILHLAQFKKQSDAKDGLFPICRECCRTPEEKEAARKKEAELAEEESLAKKGLKRCKRCNETKALEEFSYNEHFRDYKDIYCSTCVLEKNRSWREENPIKARAQGQRRRAREAEAESDFEDYDWLFALEYFNNRCAYCGEVDEVMCQEHYIPLSKGGTYTRGNIVPADRGCNSSKRDLYFDEWATGRGRNCVRPGAKDKITEYFALVATEV